MLNVNCMVNPLQGALSQGDVVIFSQSVCVMLFCVSELIRNMSDDAID